MNFKEQLESANADLYNFFLQKGDFRIFKDFSKEEMIYVFDIIKKYKGKVKVLTK